MAKAAGRTALLKKAGTAIGGLRNIVVKIDGAPIDVSDQNSAGMVTLLSGAFVGRQMTIDCDGVQEDPVLRNIGADPTQALYLTDLTFIFGNALAAKDTITGDFFMTNYTENSPYDDAIDFSASFASSGAWTLT